MGTQKREVKDPEEDGDGETPALSQAVGASLAGYGIAALSVSWSVRCDVSLYDGSMMVLMSLVPRSCLSSTGVFYDRPSCGKR